MRSRTGLGGKGRELGYNGDLSVRRYRDRDTGRGIICKDGTLVQSPRGMVPSDINGSQSS